MTSSIPKIDRRRLAAACLAAILAVVVLSAADVRVTPISVDGQVFASISAATAYTDDVRDAVQSGLPVVLTFVVDLRRSSSVWFDHTLASTTVAASVNFDNLTRVYQVSKLSDGRVVWTDRTDKEDQVRTWTTSFDRVPLSNGESLEANSEYYVRVRVRSTPHHAFFLWPWGRDDDEARATFTYIR